MPSFNPLTTPDESIVNSFSSVVSVAMVLNLIFPNKVGSIVTVRVAVSSVDPSGDSDESVVDDSVVDDSVVEELVDDSVIEELVVAVPVEDESVRSELVRVEEFVVFWATIELSVVCADCSSANTDCVDKIVGAISHDVASRRIALFLFIIRYSFSFKRLVA